MANPQEHAAGKTLGLNRSVDLNDPAMGRGGSREVAVQGGNKTYGDSSRPAAEVSDDGVLDAKLAESQAATCERLPVVPDPAEHAPPPPTKRELHKQWVMPAEAGLTEKDTK